MMPVYAVLNRHPAGADLVALVEATTDKEALVLAEVVAAKTNRAPATLRVEAYARRPGREVSQPCADPRVELMAKEYWTVTAKVRPALRRKVVQRVRARNDQEARTKAAFWFCEENDVESYVIVRVSCRAIGYLWEAPSRRGNV